MARSRFVSILPLVLGTSLAAAAPPNGSTERYVLREAAEVSRTDAEQVFGRAEAALFLEKMRRVRWLEAESARQPLALPRTTVDLGTQTLESFEPSLEDAFPEFRSGTLGGWLLKTPSVLPGLPASSSPSPADTAARAPQTPSAIVFSEGFENGLGTFQLADNRSGAYTWGATTCDSRSGQRSADAVRGGTSGGSLACASPYPSSTTTQMTHNACESLAGSTEAWLDVYGNLALESPGDRAGFYYSVDGGANLLGYSFAGTTNGFFRLVLNLKAWYRIGDVTALACPKAVFSFSSNPSVETGFGFRIDDVTITTSTPSFLRIKAFPQPASGPPPLTVAFATQLLGSSGTGTTYFWLFGDAGGSSSAAQSPTFTYQTAGTYDVSVFVSEGTTEAVASTQVVVGGAACTLSCGATVPGTGSAGAAVSFQGSSSATGCTGDPTYSWSFGDGQTSTAQSPAHAYASAGTYTWSLRVSQGGSTCDRSGSITITATAPPVAGDCNGNRTVEIGEVQRAINMLLGVEPPACGVDTSGDGRVTADELQRVINAFLGASSGVSVSISPATASVTAGGTQQFTATVTGSTNSGVTWSVREGAAGGSVTQAGLYTAPATAGTYGVVATSQADATKQATATVTVGAATVQYGIVYGTVVDTGNAALGDVLVSVGSRSASSNGQGYFTIDQVPATAEAIVTFTKTGYVPTSKILRVQVGQGSFINVSLARAEITSPIPAAQGGLVTTPGGGSVTIPGGGLVDAATGQPFSGNANVSLTLFDPTNAAHLSAFPGRFEGVTRGGQTIFFVTFGFMDVTVTGPNGPLQLASGRTAHLKIPIPASILSAAPSTLPQWYFDPRDGKWHEEGTFTRVGNAYEGDIPHFSIWNCDVGAARCTIRGRVVDTFGNPVTCARVSLENLGPRGRFTSGESCTPETGVFAVPVDANSTVSITAEKGGVKSPAFQTETCVDGGERNVGDIVLGTIPVKITLTWGQNPDDLDSHLAVPKAGGGYQHVFYPNKGTVVEDVILDTDDTSSFGPEIFSVRRLHVGTYRYSVHHYDGAGTIATSGATVNVIIEGVGIYNFRPPASGAVGINDVWRVFDLVIDSSNRVSIREIGDYLHAVGARDGAKFFP